MTQTPWISEISTTWKVSKQGVFSGLPFPVSFLNKKIYRDKITRLLQIRENTDQKKVCIWTLFTQDSLLSQRLL